MGCMFAFGAVCLFVFLPHRRVVLPLGGAGCCLLKALLPAEGVPA